MLKFRRTLFLRQVPAVLGLVGRADVGAEEVAGGAGTGRNKNSYNSKPGILELQLGQELSVILLERIV